MFSQPFCRAFGWCCLLGSSTGFSAESHPFFTLSWFHFMHDKNIFTHVDATNILQVNTSTFAVNYSWCFIKLMVPRQQNWHFRLLSQLTETETASYWLCVFKWHWVSEILMHTNSSNITFLLPGSERFRRSHHRSLGHWERLWPSHTRSASVRRWQLTASSHLDRQVNTQEPWNWLTAVPYRLQSPLQTTSWWLIYCKGLRGKELNM